MKKNYTLISLTFLLTGLLYFTGCSSKKTEAYPLPTADFTFITLGNVPPADVDFTNISKNATSYVWDFGDKTTAIIKDPRHTYTKPGTYLVKLTATGPGGSSQAEDQITIGAKKMIINTITIDSAVQVANPMYFFTTISYEQNNITLGDFFLPPSNVPYYPTASWTGLKYGASLQSDVVIKLFYRLPASATAYPAGGEAVNSFRFKPADLIKDNATYPTRTTFSNGSGATQNKISLTLSWE